MSMPLPVSAGLVFGAAPGKFAMLTREHFGNAVKDALRHYTRTDLLSGNPLRRMRVVTRLGGETASVAHLRQVLADAAETLFANARDHKLHRVLELTYFNPAPKQEAAAERLGLPFSTYRRHLNNGVDRITEWLWQREQDALQEQEAANRSGRRGRPMRLWRTRVRGCRSSCCRS